MNWQDEVRMLRQVPVYHDADTPYVRIDDVPEHMRGWFIHWLHQQQQPRVEDAEGGQLAHSWDYESWIKQMEIRLRMAEDSVAADPDREE